MESNVIPELRFPEFNDNWNERKYIDIYSFKTTNSLSREKLNYEGGDVKNIHYGDIHTKFDSLFDITKEKVPFINNDEDISRIQEDCYLKEGDLIIADASEDYNDIGKTIEIQNLNKEKVLAGLHTLLARKESADMANGFPSFLMKTRRVRLEIMKIAQGTKVLGLSKNRLDKIPLYIPNLPEQTKITTFLIAIDKRIQILEKKKTEYLHYKKGIMQKIFSCTIRFKKDDGSNFPDWEEKKMGEIGTFQTSSIDKLSKEDEQQVYLVNYMNVYRHENINNSTLENLQIVTAKSRQLETSNLLEGDILFTPSSETPSDIGHSVVIFEDLENTVFSYHLMRFRPSIKLDLMYSHYFCNIPPVLKQLSSFANGSTRFTITVGNFSKIKIQLPTFEEQQKIANFLSSIDKSIAKLGTQIEDSIVFKKGLLQKMFV